VIDILDDEEFGRRRVMNVRPPIEPVEVIPAINWSRRCPDRSRNGVANPRTELRRQAPDRAADEAFVAGPYPELFDAIANRASVDPLQFVEYWLWHSPERTHLTSTVGLNALAEHPVAAGFYEVSGAYFAVYRREEEKNTAAGEWRSAARGPSMRMSPCRSHMRIINLVVANHHPVVRSNLRSLLEREPEFKVVAEAANGREAVVLTDYKRPDVIILEVDLPIWSGMEVARMIRSSHTGTGILFYTPQTDESYLEAAFDAGACGYVAAASEQADVIEAVRTVANGRRYVSPAIGEGLRDTW
jgi:CheY-like chemotaxis protein